MDYIPEDFLLVGHNTDHTFFKKPCYTWLLGHRLALQFDHDVKKGWSITLIELANIIC